MCDVASWIYVGVALVGGAMQIDQNNTNRRYMEQATEQNKKVAEAQAVDAERLGQIQASERRLQTRLQIAQQSTGFAAQNVEQTGTALEIMGDTAMFGEVDEQRIRAGAARQAWGFRMQGYEMETQRRIGVYNSKMKNAGTVLSTVGSIAGGVNWGGLGGAASGVATSGFGTSLARGGSRGSTGYSSPFGNSLGGG